MAATGFLPPRHLVRGGFTLVELLVVIAIISLLALIIMPSVVRVRGLARMNACSLNVKTLATAVMAYQSSHEGRLPLEPTTVSVNTYDINTGTAIDAILAQYANIKIHCPSLTTGSVYRYRIDRWADTIGTGSIVGWRIVHHGSNYDTHIDVGCPSQAPMWNQAFPGYKDGLTVYP